MIPVTGLIINKVAQAPDRAIDSDAQQAPFALAGARHRERYAPFGQH